MVPKENIFVLTNEVQLAATCAALPMLRPAQIVAEPAKRDTAPAAALATALVRARDPNGVMLVLSADAVIHDGKTCGHVGGKRLRRLFPVLGVGGLNGDGGAIEYSGGEAKPAGGGVYRTVAV